MKLYATGLLLLLGCNRELTNQEFNFKDASINIVKQDGKWIAKVTIPESNKIEKYDFSVYFAGDKKMVENFSYDFPPHVKNYSVSLDVPSTYKPEHALYQIIEDEVTFQ